MKKFTRTRLVSKKKQQAKSCNFLKSFFSNFKKSTILFLLLVFASTLFASDPSETIAWKSPMMDDGRRYLALMFTNDSEDDQYLDVIENANSKGFNALYVTARMDAIKCHNEGCMIGSAPNPNWNPANRSWTQLDAQIGKARQLGMKIAIRVHFGSADFAITRSTYLWGADRLAKDETGNIIFGGWNFTKFTLSSQPAIDSAKAFLQEVLNRYGYLEGESNLLFISFSNTSSQEFEYDGSHFLDYSDLSKNDYANWYQNNYGIPNPNYPTEYSSTEGKRWYKFRQCKMKDFLSQLTGVVKTHNSNIKTVNDVGSAFDGISAKRGTLAFKSIAEHVDGFKVNDDFHYDHRFSIDILRGSLPGKWVMNEAFLTNDYSPGYYYNFGNDVFAHGGKMLAVVTVNNGYLNKHASDWGDLSTQWLAGSNGNMSPVSTTGTINYTFDEILNASFNGNRFWTTSRNIYQEWENQYNNNPSNAKPVNVVLDDSEMGNCSSCTPPSAPTLNASPDTITSGNSSNLSASGCAGTVTWSHGLGTGNSKSVSPTSTTTYTATCTVDGCTSSGANVTVTVNQLPGGNFCDNYSFTDGQLLGTALSSTVYVRVINSCWYVTTNNPSNSPIALDWLYILIDNNGWASGVTPFPRTVVDSCFKQPNETCSPADPCAFSVNATGPTSPVETGNPVTLNVSCSGECDGVTYSWSGNGISGSGNSVNFNAPGSAGSYTYTVTASKSGCSNKTDTVNITVEENGGGGTSICDDYSFTDGQLLGTSLSSTVYVRVINSCWYVTTNSPSNSPIALDWLYILIDNNGWASGVTPFPRVVVDSCFKQPSETCSGSSAILAPYIEEAGVASKALKVFPNPSNGTFETSFYLERGQKATLVLTDLQGRTLFNKVINGSGNHLEKINVSNKAAGTMLLRLIKDSGIEVRKISITR